MKVTANKRRGTVPNTQSSRRVPTRAGQAQNAYCLPRFPEGTQERRVPHSHWKAGGLRVVFRGILLVRRAVGYHGAQLEPIEEDKLSDLSPLANAVE